VSGFLTRRSYFRLCVQRLTAQDQQAPLAGARRADASTCAPQYLSPEAGARWRPSLHRLDDIRNFLGMLVGSTSSKRARWCKASMRRWRPG